MISWISNLIQKRGKIIFSVLLAIIIVAFVFTIGAGPGIVKDERNRYVNDFYGINLNNQADIRKLSNATMISRYINGIRQYDESQFQQQMLLRQVRLHLADTLAIPEPTTEQLREFIAQKRNFQDDSGRFDKTIFSEFIDSMKGGSVIDEAFVMTVLRQDYILETVDELFSAPGLVSPTELEAAFARDNTTWSIEIAKFDYEAFNPEISPSDEQLIEYYTENQLRYEIPDAYTVSYTVITIDDMPVETEATEEDLMEFYLTNRVLFIDRETELRKPDESGAEPLSEEAVFEALKSDVLIAYNRDQQSRTAAHLANDLVGQLFEESIAYKSDEFGQMLETHGLELQTLEPFTADPKSQPAGIVPDELFRTALRLDADRYYSDVVANEDQTQYYIAFLESITPSRIPSMEEVKEAVIADYRVAEKAALFSAKGAELHDKLFAAAQESESLEIEATKLSLGYEKVDTFKLVERPATVPYQILRELESLDEGEVSDMITADEFGYFIHVVEKSTPEVDKSSPAYTTIETGMNNFSAYARYQSLLKELIDAKLSVQRG
jgi:peptidyl-prolyl cis-trans isomerase D